MTRSSRWCLVIAVLGAAAQAAACEKTVRWNDDPPFSQRTASGEISGITIDQVRETLRRMGCTARLLEMPWARALAELEAGRLDILPGALQRPERSRYAYFSAPGPLFANALFVSTAALKAKRYGKLADLRGRDFRLGVQIGVSYGPEYDALMQDPEFVKQVQRVSSRQSLWKMVVAGRLDGVLADQLTGRLEIAQLQLQDHIKEAGVTLPHAGASVAFSKKSIDLAFVERYDKAFETMQQDGSLAAILRRYAVQ